ncbi:MAG: hypothetical protein ACRCX2_20255 [Paraclostridium sp.]
MDIIYHEGMIREYDLQSANVSCLVENDYISEEMYFNLMEGDKEFRNIIIGKLIIRYPEVQQIISENIKHYVNLFIGSNKLTESNILEIAKDAIFTNNVKDQDAKKLKLKFGEYVKFIPKHNYRSLFEISIKDGSSIKLKLYLCYEKNSVVSRFGKLDLENPLYGYIVDLLRHKFSHTTSSYNSTLRSMIIEVNKGKLSPVCSTCSNERLVEAFRELSTI